MSSWEEETKTVFRCSPLKTVNTGPPGNFSGICGLSVVFVKAHLISSFRLCVHGSQPDAVHLAILERVFSRAAYGSATPVSHPDNLDTAIFIAHSHSNLPLHSLMNN